MDILQGELDDYKEPNGNNDNSQMEEEEEEGQTMTYPKLENFTPTIC